MILFGIDPLKAINTLKGLPQYFHDLHILQEQIKKSDNHFPLGKAWPCLDDMLLDSGMAKGHYFHQDLLVARRIYINKPKIHVDVGSSIDGFVAHVASYREIEVLDIRPLSSKIPNVKFTQADLMGELNNMVNYCDSLSCLHALEHFGLGRYGDQVKVDGHIDGLNNLYNILKQNGKFYFAVPIGPQRIEFNAHRVFSIKYLMDYFNAKYHIDNFSYVDDKGDLHENVILDDVNIKANYNCYYGCGIFEMTKI